MENPKETRRKFLKHGMAASAGLALTPALAKGNSHAGSSKSKRAPQSKEWRNKQSGMAYRMWGSTGMMVSEIVQGTTPWKDESYVRVFEGAFERGVNYIDTATAYSKGQAEILIGKYLKQSGNRDNIFLSNKISFYDEFVVKLTDDILKGLPSEKQEALRKKARAMIAERGVLTPGIHFLYFPGQERKIETTYIRYLITQEYGQMNQWKPKIKKHMHKLVEDSLRATDVDHFDVLHCPHGVAMPEMLEDAHIAEVFAELKQKGSIRFSACSMHNDVAANLEKAIEVGHYDGAMLAYNIGNHAALNLPLQKAKEAGMGIVAMKVARIINTNPTPQWRIDKLNSAIYENLSIYGKAYLWALQNPNLSCCVSEMVEPTHVVENASVTGKKVELGPV